MSWWRSIKAKADGALEFEFKYRQRVNLPEVNNAFWSKEGQRHAEWYTNAKARNMKDLQGRLQEVKGRGAEAMAEKLEIMDAFLVEEFMPAYRKLAGNLYRELEYREKKKPKN